MNGMILGRNTQQWLGLTSSIIGFVGLVIGVAFPGLLGPATIILNGLSGVLGVLIMFIANTLTTPTNDPQLVEDTMVRVTDEGGRMIGHAPITVPEPVEEDEDEAFEDDPADVEDGVA